MVTDAVKRIRELEQIKEREIQNAEREAAQILAQLDNTIEEYRPARLREVEEMAAREREKMLRNTELSTQKIIDRYEEEAERLRQLVSKRIDRAVAVLLQSLEDQYGH
ncbi:MAG TPA: hypothetical protein VLH40_08460 [Atribacteraceae bacterium]|nr:hypothetical protein [Atribacteraceae bacterium]